MTAVDVTRLTLGVAAAAASLPGTLEIGILTFGALLPAKRPRTAEASGKRIAIVVPAHNEAGGIAACVRSLFESEARSRLLEVVVVADNCTDPTAALASAAGARVLERFNDRDRGKGYALDFAFRTLLPEGFEIFIIIDADTVVSRNLIAEFRAWFAAGADALQCRYAVRNPGASVRTRLMNVALLAFNVLRPRGRGNLGLSSGILGNGFAVARHVIESTPYDAHSVVEDLEYHLRLARAGYIVRFADGATVYGDMPANGKGVRIQRSRWEGGRFRMIAQFGPSLAAEVLHGKSRLLEPFLELLLLPLAFHVVLLLMALAAPPGIVRGYGATALALVALHIVTAILVGGGGPRDFGVLAIAPFYIVWKIGMIPLLWRSSRRQADWVRTERATLGDPGK